MSTQYSSSQSPTVLDLATYHVDPQRGFLPTPDPLAQLPTAFACWEEVARELPKLLVAGAVRHSIKQLPLLKVSALQGEHQLERAMGLIHVLENLSAPSTLGPAISGAFIATLYGVSSANLLFLPVGNKLKEMSAAEVNHRYMTQFSVRFPIVYKRPGANLSAQPLSLRWEGRVNVGAPDLPRSTTMIWERSSKSRR